MQQTIQLLGAIVVLAGFVANQRFRLSSDAAVFLLANAGVGGLARRPDRVAQPVGQLADQTCVGRRLKLAETGADEEGVAAWPGPDGDSMSARILGWWTLVKSNGWTCCKRWRHSRSTTQW